MSGPPDPNQRPKGPPPDRLAPGVAVKRFRWDDLLAAFERAVPTEDRWEGTAALPGELLGRVRVWAAADTPGAARPFAEAFEGAALRWADPAPFDCGGVPDLFLAAIYATGPRQEDPTPGGHGVWHAAGLPTGASLCVVGDAGPCTVTPMVAGLDFLVAPGGTASPSRLAATSADALYVDPDPVRLPLGGLRVAIGDILESPDAGLLWVKGGARDVCRPYTDAWRR